MAIKPHEPAVLTLPTRDVGAMPRAKEHRRTAESNEAIELSVVIPVFNEERTVEELIRRVLPVPLRKQMIVVDDGSTDGTAGRLARFDGDDKVVLLSHPRNRGKGAAIRTALPYLQGRFTIIQDADLEYDPADYAPLIQILRRGESRVVYGSRYLDGRNQLPITPFWFGVKLLNVLVRLLYGARVTDEATCYKAFDTRLLKSLDLRCTGFEFCPEVTAKVLRGGHGIVELPISYRHRTVHEGKKLRTRDGLRAIWTLVKYRFVQ